MAYFDNAATTYPKPECVYAFMDEFYRNRGGSAGRGNYALAASAKNVIEETRGLLCELLHAPAKQVIFTPSATIALNMIIQGVIVKGAKTVYISPFEHNAVTRVLHHFEETGQIAVLDLPVSADLQYDLERTRYLFDEKKPDLVIMSHASNVIGNTVRHYREKLDGFSRPAERTYSSLDERYKAILRSKNRIQEWEDELVEISDQIKGKESMRQYETELADIRARLKDLHNKKDRLNREDGAAKGDIERYKKVYDSLTAVSGKNRQAMELIAYAEAIREWLADTYRNKEETIREDLEAKVNEIFEGPLPVSLAA